MSCCVESAKIIKMMSVYIAGLENDYENEKDVLKDFQLLVKTQTSLEDFE